MSSLSASAAPGACLGVGLEPASDIQALTDATGAWECIAVRLGPCLEREVEWVPGAACLPLGTVVYGAGLCDLVAILSVPAGK